MADSLSGFFFDVMRWRSSKSAQRMSFAERGVYLEMMFEQWDKRFLPDDPILVAALIAMSESQTAEVVAAWPVVRPKFLTDEKHPDRIYNAKLELTRRQQRANYKRRREAGSVAGKASAAKRNKAHALPVNDSLTTVQRSSTEEKRREEIRRDLNRGEGKDRRSKRPIFTGQRLTVFEWMFDDLDRMLTPHTEAFDLHSWFFELDARCVANGTILPERDGGVWLKAQTLAEAQRRGLPLSVATAPTSPPAGSKRVAALVAGGDAFLRRQS